MKEAGWDNLTEGRELEYEVKGMLEIPTLLELVMDYVLWGKDGKPLAVVEAKHKQMLEKEDTAELYANC